MKLLACWAGLVLLSVGTVMSGAAGWWWLVVLAQGGRAWVMADGFRGVRYARWGWRAAMVAWPVVLLAGMVVMR